MKTKNLTVHGMIVMRSSTDPVGDHYPGYNGPQLRAIVATKTKKEAAELLGVSLHHFNEYASPTGNDAELAAALSKPGQVFAAPTQSQSDIYFEITRRPPIIRKRRKAVPYTPSATKPTFTREEIEVIMDRFAMANDLVGQSIADKAKQMLD